MDNLPKDPSNPNNGNNNNPPPPFGSGFTPHANPVDPNNPYQTQPQPNPVPPPAQIPSLSTPNPPNTPDVPENPDTLKHEHYSKAAQNKPRDEHGHFIHTNPDPQTTNQSGQTPPTTPTSQTAPNPSFLPPLIEINQNTKPTEKEDPPLFGFFLTNPVTYLKKFLSKLLKRQMITLRIPVLALIVVMVGTGGFGVGFKSGLNYAVGKLFPNFSPILHRSITAQGIIQKSTKGYYLQANDKNKTLWTLQPKSQNVNLSDFEGQKVEVKGNLTPTPNLIEVSEVISFEPKPSPTPTTQTTPIVSNTSTDNSTDSLTTPSTGLTNPSPANLPALYSGLTWETPKNKTLTFTSGNRKIEQEVIYIESLQSNTYPQDFISYYTQQLTNSGFKQTLNSQEPSSSSTTYSKGNLFLTYGVKNIYSGTGDSKQLVGYKAYIEHN